MYSRDKIYAAAAVAAAMVCFTAACSKAPVRQEKAAVSLASTRLAVIPDGQEPMEFYFSEDGRRLAYVVKKDGKAFLMLDGKESKRYDEFSRIVFSPDCRDVAYKVTEEGRQSVVVNGKVEKFFDRIGTLQFAPDGRVVYEAMRNKKWFVMAGRRESPAFDQPYEMPIISPDGKKMAYIEQHVDTKKINLVVCSLDMRNRTTGKDYDAIVKIKASKTSSRFAYIVNTGGKQAVVSTGFTAGDASGENEGPAYDQVLTLDISDDGAHLAYLARRDKSVFLVKDGVELPFPEHEMRSQTVIANDGRSFNAGVIRGRFFPVMDGKKYDDSYDGIKDPVFSADGSQFAFVARKGDRHYVVVNGSSGPQYDMVVSPQFSPDGSRLIYRARQDGRRFAVVADARGATVAEQPRYDMVWQPVVTPAGKAIAYAVKTGKELWWKVEPLQ